MRKSLLLLATASAALLALPSCSSQDIGCASDDDCRSGRVCLSNKCVTAGDGVNNTPNNESNTPNNVSNVSNEPINSNSPNINPNNVDPNNPNPDPDLQLCQTLCDRLLGSCLDEVCNIDPMTREAYDILIDICIYEGFEEGDPGCLEAVANNPDAREEVERLIGTLTCESPELEQFRCEELELDEECGCDPARFNDVGDSCNRNGDCDGGIFPGVCLDESNQPPFPDGYCVAIGCPADPDRPVGFDDGCGEGNVCWAAGQEMNGVCVDGCEAHSECRIGYQCRLAGVVPGELRPIRMCLPECGPNLLCRNENERCSQGRCEFECTEATPTGEPSGREICEALGFDCQPDDTGIFWCVMP